MKSVVVTDSISRAAGGLFDAERRLHQELAAQGVGVSVFALQDEFTPADAGLWRPIKPHTFPTSAPKALGRSSGLRGALMEQRADVLYRAGLWTLPSRYAHQWSRIQRKPEIIAPHGMLDPWAVRNSAWKKRWVRWAYEDVHLRAAACLRALCQSEADAIRAFGLKNPIAVIPNGIDLPAIPKAETLKAEKLKGESGNPFAILDARSSQRKVLLYLGRLHPKKGLVNLLKAWAAVSKELGTKSKEPEWILAIAGWDQGGHEAELKGLCDELGLSFADIRDQQSEVSAPTSVLRPPTSVVFLGPQFGAEKAACYANCGAFILPSFSEGLPMVVLEAWAYGKPVLMTPECNLPEGFAANAAIQIDRNPRSIAEGLRQLVRLQSSDLSSLGARGRALVAEKFTWPSIAEQMLKVYEWVLSGATPPGCIWLD